MGCQLHKHSTDAESPSPPPPPPPVCMSGGIRTEGTSGPISVECSFSATLLHGGAGPDGVQHEECSKANQVITRWMAWLVSHASPHRELDAALEVGGHGAEPHGHLRCLRRPLRFPRLVFLHAPLRLRVPRAPAARPLPALHPRAPPSRRVHARRVRRRPVVVP